jgi:hypothetical protein
MTRGNFVETAQKPSWDSVEEYRDHLKHESPTELDWTKLWDPDIECTCCSQKAPSEAAAMLKVEDQTPFTKKFGITEVSPTGKQGETMWLCADCYKNGVRPKFVYFGEIKWNKMGRKVKKRSEESFSNPW